MIGMITISAPPVDQQHFIVLQSNHDILAVFCRHLPRGDYHSS